LSKTATRAWEGAPGSAL